MLSADILQPYRKLVEINVCGEICRVPENNYILRCLQFLRVEEISAGDFCWNGDCANCRIWIANEAGESEKPVLACRTIVAESMKIVRLNDEISAAWK